MAEEPVVQGPPQRIQVRVRHRLRRLADHLGEPGQPHGRHRALPRWPAPGQRVGQRPARLAQPPAQEPVPGHRVHQPQRLGPFERQPQVAALLVEPFQAVALAVPAQVGALGQRRVVARVPFPDQLVLTGLPQPLDPIGRHRLQQPEPRPRRDQRAVDQPGQQVEHVVARLRAHLLRRLQRAPVS
ncbi:hypothetical protein AB0K48_02580, partial [Nonomuraea sp. NPDC055795]